MSNNIIIDNKETGNPPQSAKAREIILEYQGCNDGEIIEAFCTEYYEDSMPWVKEAFDAMSIAEHEVTTWVYLNLK